MRTVSARNCAHVPVPPFEYILAWRAAIADRGKLIRRFRNGG
jgi:hypothetical protein